MLLFAVGCLLFVVADCWVFVVWCSLFAVRCLLFVAVVCCCRLLIVVHRSLPVVQYWLIVV